MRVVWGWRCGRVVRMPSSLAPTGIGVGGEPCVHGVVSWLLGVQGSFMGRFLSF